MSRVVFPERGAGQKCDSVLPYTLLYVVYVHMYMCCMCICMQIYVHKIPGYV